MGYFKIQPGRAYFFVPSVGDYLYAAAIGIFLHFLKGGIKVKNWQTTVAGLIAGLPQIIALLGLSIPTPFLNLITALGVIGIGYFAKDKDVTGGTKQQ